MSDSWIQLDGVEQILPYDGWEYEQLRRRLLDCMYSNGYEYVVPPLADFVESLLGGTNGDLDLLTVKAPDYASGKMFGIRADITPQIARMALHHLCSSDAVVRLCYFGATLLARPRKTGGSREQLQFGSELFGSSSSEADCEIVRLMTECLALANVQSLSVSLGHVGIIDAVLEALQISSDKREEIYTALTIHSKPQLHEIAERSGLSKESVNTLCDLMDLNGDVPVIQSANSRLKGMSDKLDLLLSQFETFVKMLSAQLTDVGIYIDYAQVGSYKYHSGVIFSAYGAGYSHALANGGRYDNVLSKCGTPCPATGFSGDLRLLRDAIAGNQKKAILVPRDTHIPLHYIDELICNENRLIRQLPHQSIDSLKSLCDRMLKVQDGNWKVVPIDDIKET